MNTTRTASGSRQDFLARIGEMASEQIAAEGAFRIRTATGCLVCS